MSETDLWRLVFVLALVGVFIGEYVICQKWGRWYILPILFFLPTLWCVVEFFRSDGWDSLAWLIFFLAAGALLLAALVSALVGMLVRRHRRRREASQETTDRAQ